jgi:hypothetical protein
LIHIVLRIGKHLQYNSPRFHKSPNIILPFLLQGLVLLWISAKSDPTEQRRGFELGNFYLPALLMTLGKSGIGFLLRAFLADQLCERDSPNVDEDQLSGRTNVWWRIAWFFGSIIALFWLSYVPWKEKFMVSALVMGASLVFFLCGFKLYFYRRPTGSPLGMFGRVLKATVCKWHLGYPHSESEFNWQNKPRQRCTNHKGEILLSPNVPLLR